MSTRNWILTITALALGMVVAACSSPNVQPVGLTPIPTLSPGATPTLVAALEAAALPVSAAGGKADPAQGAPIYLLNCSPCHGVAGQGISAPALRNSQFIQTGDEQAILATIANGRPGTNMPAWLQSNGGPLTDAQIADVVAYLHTQVGVPPLPTSTPYRRQPHCRNNPRTHRFHPTHRQPNRRARPIRAIQGLARAWPAMPAEASRSLVNTVQPVTDPKGCRASPIPAQAMAVCLC